MAMMMETARREVRNQLGGAAVPEILVGIPTFNNARTMGTVMGAVKTGLSKAFPRVPTLVVNADAGSQDGTPEMIRQAAAADLPTALIQHMTGHFPQPLSLHELSESGVPGRERAFQAFFALADEFQVKACVVLDANVHSMTAEWIEALLQPVLEKEADYVAPLFRRPRYEGSLTNSLIYPLSRALYGRRMRYHSGGGYGFSGKLARLYLARDVWEGEAARFGVDTWLTTVAIAEGCKLHQAYLGAKLQEAHATRNDLGSVLAQAVGSIFHFMQQYQDAWEGIRGSTPVPMSGLSSEVGTETVAVNVERMVRGFRQGLADLLPIWEIILAPETLAGVLSLGLADADEFRFPPGLWVQAVYDFASAYHERVLHREHLLKSLAPLYLGRTASFVLETRDGAPEDVEQAIETLCQTFEGMKPYLTQRWRFQ
jgi:hypothetical protein